MKYKKSQAALEFLTTYGWAFLVILIMIGTLAYFGILSPGKLLPNRCNFGAEFQCLDYQIASNGFKLRLKNGIGEAIDVTSITLSAESATAYSCGAPTPALPISSWKSGEIKDITWTCSGGGITAGEKAKVLVTVRYNSVASGSTYSKDVKGEVFSNVI